MLALIQRRSQHYSNQTDDAEQVRVA